MAQAEQKRSLFGSRSKGKRFTFEGKNIETERLVRGEVVAKDEEEARKKLQRRGIRPLRISKVKTSTQTPYYPRRHHGVYAPTGNDDEGRLAADAGF